MTEVLHLVAVGLDHTTAGVELRERLAFSAAEIPAALRRLTDPADPLVEQAAILSTCNRVELYGAARSRGAADALVSFLAGRRGLDGPELASALYVHRGDEVLRHLAATAAGMHSLVLGEAQIQGQVRTALEQAMAAGTAGPELRRMFEAAISAGRRVRADTGLGRGLTSVPHASVEFARRRLGTLRHSTVLLIGAGRVGELAADQIARHGARDLLVVGRDVARAERLARRHGGRAVVSDRLGDAVAAADVVISSTGAPRPVVERRHVERAAARRGADEPPLLLIDLAVPRDIDPAVGGLRGVELHTLDDLRPVVDRALAQRHDHLPAAHAIVRAEAARFTRWLTRRAAEAARRAEGIRPEPRAVAG